MGQSSVIQKNILIFDIDSAAVCAYLVSYRYNKKLDTSSHEVAWSDTFDIIHYPNLDTQHFFGQTLKTCEGAAHAALKESSGRVIDDVICVIGTPWVSTQKRTSRYVKQHDFNVNELLINEILGKEKKDSLSTNLEYHLFNDLMVVDQTLLNIEINGYRSLNPVGKSARELKTRSLLSVISQQVYDAFGHVFERVFHRTPQMFSNIHFLYDAVHTHFKNEDDVLILDISGEVTDVMVVQNDTVTHIGSFPKGYQTIIRDAQKQFGTHSYRWWFKYISKNIGIDNKNIDSQYSQVLQKSFRSWLRVLHDTLGYMAQDGLLPSQLVLVSHARLESWLTSALLGSPELQTVLYGSSSIEVLHWSRHDQTDFSSERHSDQMHVIVDTAIHKYQKLWNHQKEKK